MLKKTIALSFLLSYFSSESMVRISAYVGNEKYISKTILFSKNEKRETLQLISFFNQCKASYPAGQIKLLLANTEQNLRLACLATDDRSVANNVFDILSRFLDHSVDNFSSQLSEINDRCNSFLEDLQAGDQKK